MTNNKRIFTIAIVVIVLLFGGILFSSQFEQTTTSDVSGGIYDVIFRSTGTITELGDEVRIQMDEEGSCMPGEEVQVEFSTMFTNARIHMKKFEVGQKVQVGYFLYGVKEEEKVLVVERITPCEDNEAVKKYYNGFKI